jgi:murein DD-endopeptidase MepM/ murein hydrolase activator NlpD
VAYDPAVIDAIDRVLNRYNASPKVRKAAYEGTLVETGGKNLRYGDRDSLGAFQQRPSQGWGTPAQILDPEYAATQFVTRAIEANKTGRYKSAGALAQAVQRSAFPDRYDAVGTQAESILASLGGSGGGSRPQSAPGPSGSSSSAAPQLLDAGQGSDFTSLLGSLLAKPQPAQASTTPIQAPSFAAGPKLPAGAQLLSPTQAPQRPDAGGGLADALSLVAALGGSNPTVGSPGGSQTADGPQTPQPSSGGAAPGSGISPHAQPGDPVVSGKQSVGGLHQTDGLAGYPAHDFFAPAGSHAVAPVTGTVIKLSGHDPKNGPTNGPHGPLGWSVYVKGDDGRTYFLTHMGSRNVKVGQTVQQGQIIGTVANYDKYGTPSHIHMGVSG